MPDRNPTFVLLRSCKILKSFTSFCFVFTYFWNTYICFTIDFEKVGLIPFDSLCYSKLLEQPGRFRYDLQKFRDKQFVSFSILLFFGLNSFLLRCLLKLFVSLRYFTFSRTKLHFRFDLDKLKANIGHFTSLQRPCKNV